MNKPDSGSVFSSKAEKYLKYRWGYTPDVFETIMTEANLDGGSVVADIGAGPGTLAKHFVGKVGQVILVEPNPVMMKLAVRQLKAEPSCRFLPGRSEATGLSDSSVDLVTAAQASNWFQPEPTRAEFERILKPGGWLAFLRFQVVDQDPALAKAVEEAFPTQTDTESLMAGLGVPASYYFGHEGGDEYEFPFTVRQRWQEFIGGISTASYAPDEGSSWYPGFERKLKTAFDRYSQGGVLEVKVVIKLQLGRMS